MTTAAQPNRLVHAECLDLLGALPDASVALVYIDPPFNTGRTQRLSRLTVTQDPNGTRTGFGGRTYSAEPGPALGYADTFDDYTAWLRPRMVEAHRVMASNATLYFHIDYREVHYCKVMLDGIFGRGNFLNEVIWAYDYGARTRRRWPAKHDNILVYARDATNYVFNHDALDRIPYMAPGLVTAEKAARGKTPTDVWWQTIVPTNSRERTGYPTQKPVAILNRIVAASSLPGDTVLDFFAGSGTTGVAAHAAGRRFVLCDESADAIEVAARRFEVAGIPFLRQF